MREFDYDWLENGEDVVVIVVANNTITLTIREGTVR
jgi:hypothetical protein